MNPQTAREIYDECNEKLSQPEYSARGMMRRYHVEAVCTTDDPIDSLEYHIKTRESGFEIKMLPTWRPDKAMAVEVPADFRSYVEKLAEVSGVIISNFDDMIAALRKRHDFFAEQGCRLSDHGIEEFYAEDYTDAEIKKMLTDAGFEVEAVYGDLTFESPKADEQRAIYVARTKKSRNKEFNESKG